LSTGRQSIYPNLKGALGVLNLYNFKTCFASGYGKPMSKKLFLAISSLFCTLVAPNKLLQSCEMMQFNSNFWNNILSIKEFFWHNISWHLGNDSNIRFSVDKWLGNNTIKSMFPNVTDLALDPYSPIKEQVTLIMVNGNGIY